MGKGTYEYKKNGSDVITENLQTLTENNKTLKNAIALK